MPKKELVDELIANCPSWKEEDRSGLMALSDAAVDRLIADAIADNEEDEKKKKDPPKPVTAEEYLAAAPEGIKGKLQLVSSTAANSGSTTEAPKPASGSPVPLTLEQYIAGAPGQIQEVLNAGLTAYNEERARLVTAITANKANRFPAEYLQKKPVEELRMLAALATASAPAVPAAPLANFYGNGVAVPSQVDEEKPLGVPSMAFNEKGFTGVKY